MFSLYLLQVILYSIGNLPFPLRNTGGASEAEHEDSLMFFHSIHLAAMNDIAN